MGPLPEQRSHDGLRRRRHRRRSELARRAPDDRPGRPHPGAAAARPVPVAAGADVVSIDARRRRAANRPDAGTNDVGAGRQDPSDRALPNLLDLPRRRFGRAAAATQPNDLGVLLVLRVAALRRRRVLLARLGRVFLVEPRCARRVRGGELRAGRDLRTALPRESVGWLAQRRQSRRAGPRIYSAHRLALRHGPSELHGPALAGAGERPRVGDVRRSTSPRPRSSS